jgi:hypothetical protein
MKMVELFGSFIKREYSPNKIKQLAGCYHGKSISGVKQELKWNVCAEKRKKKN